MSDYPPGSYGYERERLLHNAQTLAATAPWPLRWFTRRWLRGIERQIAELDAVNHAVRQELVNEISTWSNE